MLFTAMSSTHAANTECSPSVGLIVGPTLTQHWDNILCLLRWGGGLTGENVIRHHLNIHYIDHRYLLYHMYHINIYRLHTKISVGNTGR